MCGRGNSQFDPDAGVTYAEAIKMIIVALGYEEQALAKGGYPDGYVAVADELGILENADSARIDPHFNEMKAARGDIACMLVNAMELE